MREQPAAMEKYTVKHQVVLWLHAFFVYSIFIDANLGNFISLDIYSTLVK